MYNMSASQGQRFAEVAREMTERVRALGPSPVGRKAILDFGFLILDYFNSKFKFKI